MGRRLPLTWEAAVGGACAGRAQYIAESCAPSRAERGTPPLDGVSACKQRAIL